MKTMKQTVLLLALVALSWGAQAQERQIKLSFQTGYFKADNEYPRMHAGANFGGDAGYFITKRFFLTAHFNYGTGKYYEDRRTDFPNDRLYPETNTNADLTNITMGLMAGYCYPITAWMNVSAQAGFAQYVEIARFPIRVVSANPNVLQGYTHGDNIGGENVGASFPVKFSVGFIPWKHLEIGVVGGFYVEPDFSPLVGWYIGPQVGVVF